MSGIRWQRENTDLGRTASGATHNALSQPSGTTKLRLPREKRLLQKCKVWDKTKAIKERKHKPSDNEVAAEVGKDVHTTWKTASIHENEENYLKNKEFKGDVMAVVKQGGSPSENQIQEDSYAELFPG